MIASDAFYSPQAIKILEVKNLQSDDIKTTTGEILSRDVDGPRCLINISGENRVGGTLKTEYVLWTSDWKYSDVFAKKMDNDYLLHKKGELVKFVDTNDHYSDAREFDNVDVGNLNRALTQHWQDLGLI